MYRYFHPISIVQKELKGETLKNEKTFTFKFYENCFKIQDNNQVDILKYYKLRKIFETENFFYLYLDKNHAFILNKNCFLTGTSLEFSTFIKKKCFLRFRKYNMK